MLAAHQLPHLAVHGTAAAITTAGGAAAAAAAAFCPVATKFCRKVTFVHCCSPAVPPGYAWLPGTPTPQPAKAEASPAINAAQHSTAQFSDSRQWYRYNFRLLICTGLLVLLLGLEKGWPLLADF
jgi:hypothetical protein